METSEITTPIPADEQHQSQEKNKESVVLEHDCSVLENIEHSLIESRFLIENLFSDVKENDAVVAKEVSNLSSFENQTLQQNQMDVDDYSKKIQDKNDTLIVEESKEDSINTIESIPTAEPEKSEDKNIENAEYIQLTYKWTAPKLLCSAKKDFKPTEKCENYTKGCFWSPDGTCILVPSEDFRFRIFDVPRELYTGILPEDFHVTELESSVRIKEGGLIYDCCWYPYMSSWQPSTCCFLAASQGSPIHLWDAFTGQLRATYRAYNQVDEVEAAISVQFTDSGTKVWSGYKNALRTFDSNRPGRQTETIYLKKDFPNVTGLVSCIRENPGMSGLIAFGTYSKCIGLYKDGPLCCFQTSSGVTQIEFSPCGTKIYSAVRRGSEFLCWDLRNPGTVLYSLQNRQSDSNQRIQFSLSYNGEQMVSGGTDGTVRIWEMPSDLQVEEELDPRYKIIISKDCINGVDLHKNLPMLAVSTGTRICDQENHYRDNSLRFYWVGNR
ncbi:telomerase Cajal body protein 1-like [Phymastichus coffea]|uniref:telomerase Cajal body protein 1-like n=1 Tax=Phymastichus coffea TaxID=108790 RepID=UPI00273B54F8|nr:telomerase Cajal body protein 1-like [Phymastichus coffea]